MSDLIEIRDLVVSGNESFNLFRKANDERLDGIKSELGSQRDRIEELESRGKTPARASAANSPPSDYTVIEPANNPDGPKSYMVSGKQRLSSVPALRKEEPISLDRWLAALVLRNESSDKEARDAVAEAKSLATTTTGALLPAGYVTQWIDMARDQSVLSAAGMRVVTMNEQTLTYSHQTADPTFAWRSSEGASLSATDPTFALRTLTAKTIAVRTQISLEASQDIPDIGAQITRAYTKAFGAAIDQAGIRGTSPAPTGLQTLSGVGSVAGGGAQTNYDKLVDGVTTFLLAKNRLEELTGVIMHPTILGKYNKIKTGISGDQTVLSRPPILANAPWFATTNNDAYPVSPQSYMIELGNFTDLVMGIRLNPTIRILDGTLSMATNLLVEVVGVARVDIVAVRPASFVRITGLS